MTKAIDPRVAKEDEYIKNLDPSKTSYGLFAGLHSIQDSEVFGKAVEYAGHNRMYVPNQGSHGYTKMIQKAFARSRRSGKLYSGQASEIDVLEAATEIIQASLIGLKVGKVLDLMGYTGDRSKFHADEYLGDLQNGSDEQKKIFRGIIGSYMNRNANLIASEALKLEGEDSSGLEELVK